MISSLNEVVQALKISVAGVRVDRARSCEPRLFSWRQLYLYFLCNGACHFLLQCEDITQVAFVAFSPQVGVSSCLHQLRGNADALARAQRRSFDNGIDVKLACNLRKRSVHALVSHSRSSRNDS